MTETTHADRNGGVFLVSAARTPIGKFGGALADVPAVELGGVAIRAAVERSGLPTDVAVDEVLMGQVLQAGAGQAPARQAALRGGLPVTTSATTINRVCGSALKAIMLGAAEIRAGDAEVVVAGGMESMNGAPYFLPKARFGYRLGNGTLVDATVQDGLWCAVEGCHMGTHAERVAISNKVSREDQDEFALRSHQRAVAAIDEGRFEAEIAPVTVRDAKGRETSWPSTRARAGTRRSRRCAKLKPAFDLPDRARTAATATSRHGHGRQRARASPTARRPRSSPASGRSSDTASSHSPGSSATPRPRWSRSGCSSPRSRASAGSSIGSRCRSRRST